MDTHRLDWSRFGASSYLPSLQSWEDMIKMRKLLTLLFAVAVALSLSMPAMADEKASTSATYTTNITSITRSTIKDDKDRNRDHDRGFPFAYCNFAYSALASFRMGMSGSASFQRVRKSW